MRKNVLIAVILFLLVGFGALIYLNTWQHRGKVPVVINVSPSDADVMVDGQPLAAGKKVYLEPGKRSFSASRQYFDTLTTAVDVSKNDVDRIIVLILPATSTAAKSYLREHPKEQALRESLGGQLANEQGTAARSKTPLVELLPFIDREFRIDYGASQKNSADPTAIAITITSTSESSKQAALDWIKFKGFDPADLELIYKSF